VSGGDHKRLRAYQLAREVGREVWSRTALWPKYERWAVGMQLVRAADSVGANIAEAQGRWHRPDQRRLLYVARGSLHELEHWLEVAEERDLLLTETSRAIPELARTLNGLIKTYERT